MKRKYVKLNEHSLWHVGTKTIWTMCGRRMPSDNSGGLGYKVLPWFAVADKPDGPVCKTCLRALARWNEAYGEET